VFGDKQIVQTPSQLLPIIGVRALNPFREERFRQQQIWPSSLRQIQQVCSQVVINGCIHLVEFWTQLIQFEIYPSFSKPMPASLHIHHQLRNWEQIVKFHHNWLCPREPVSPVDFGDFGRKMPLFTVQVLHFS
jgi:hypothetical protein